MWVAAFSLGNAVAAFPALSSPPSALLLSTGGKIYSRRWSTKGTIASIRSARYGNGERSSGLSMAEAVAEGAAPQGLTEVAENDLFPGHFGLESNCETGGIGDAKAIGINVLKMTEIFLDDQSHPLGSLSAEVVDAALPVMNAWAKSNSIDGALKAEQILHRMEAEREAGNEEATVSTWLYTAVIDAWSRSGDHSAASRAEAVIAEMESLFESGKNVDAKPSVISYNAFINAICKRPANAMEDLSQIAVQAEAVLRRMQETAYAKPNTRTYNGLIQAYAASGNARKCEEVLGRMLQLSEDGTPRIRPDRVSYNTVIGAWSSSAERGSAQRAESILSTMQQLCDAGDMELCPDQYSYTGVVNAWARSDESDSAQRAEEIIKRMEFHGVTSDAFCWNSILDAWARAKSGGFHVAEEFLARMEREGNASTVSYNIVLNALALSEGDSMVPRAEALLARLEQLYAETDNIGLKPDVISYSTVINVLRKSAVPNAEDRVEEILNRMLDLSEAGDATVAPNTVMWNSVLGCLAEKGAAERAELLLNRMEDMYEKGESPCKPNTISYTTVINAYARSGENGRGKNAERILERMQEAYDKGNVDAKPNANTYNSVINAWVQSGERGSCKRAQEILFKMEKGNVAPNVISYTTVMHGWAKSGARGAAQRAEDIFKHMHDMYKAGNEAAKPNAFSYSVIIDALVKSGEKGSIKRAESLLYKMESVYRKGDAEVKPNTIQVTQVIDGWSKSGDALAGQKAEELLNRLEDLYRTYGEDVFKPTSITYNCCINAWAKSRQFGKARKAKDVLDRMVQMYQSGNEDVKPSVFPYTAVLNACAYTIGDMMEKREALQIASATYKELCLSDFGKPNSVCYGTFLRVCSNLIPAGESRTSSMATVFKKCCADGQVNEMVLRTLQSALSYDELCTLLQCSIAEDSRVDLAHLPPEWSANVKREKTSRRR